MPRKLNAQDLEQLYSDYSSEDYLAKVNQANIYLIKADSLRKETQDYFNNLYEQLDFSNNDEVNNLSDFTSRLLYDEKFGEDVYNRTDAKDLYEDHVLFNGANVAKIEGPDLLHIDPELEAEFNDPNRLNSIISQAAPLKSNGSSNLEFITGGTNPEQEEIVNFIETVRNDYKGKLAVVQNPYVDNEKVVIFPDGEFTRIRDITTEDDNFFSTTGKALIHGIENIGIELGGDIISEATALAYAVGNHVYDLWSTEDLGTNFVDNFLNAPTRKPIEEFQKQNKTHLATYDKDIEELDPETWETLSPIEKLMHYQKKFANAENLAGGESNQVLGDMLGLVLPSMAFTRGLKWGGKLLKTGPLKKAFDKADDLTGAIKNKKVKKAVELFGDVVVYDTFSSILEANQIASASVEQKVAEIQKENPEISKEDATATALYQIKKQWPTNVGHLLVSNFVEGMGLFTPLRYVRGAGRKTLSAAGGIAANMAAEGNEEYLQNLVDQWTEKKYGTGKIALNDETFIEFAAKNYLSGLSEDENLEAIAGGSVLGGGMSSIAQGTQLAKEYSYLYRTRDLRKDLPGELLSASNRFKTVKNEKGEELFVPNPLAEAAHENFVKEYDDITEVMNALAQNGFGKHKDDIQHLYTEKISLFVRNALIKNPNLKVETLFEVLEREFSFTEGGFENTKLADALELSEWDEIRTKAIESAISAAYSEKASIFDRQDILKDYFEANPDIDSDTQQRIIDKVNSDTYSLAVGLSSAQALRNQYFTEVEEDVAKKAEGLYNKEDKTEEDKEFLKDLVRVEEGVFHQIDPENRAKYDRFSNLINLYLRGAIRSSSAAINSGETLTKEQQEDFNEYVKSIQKIAEEETKEALRREEEENKKLSTRAKKLAIKGIKKGASLSGKGLKKGASLSGKGLKKGKEGFKWAYGKIPTLLGKRSDESLEAEEESDDGNSPTGTPPSNDPSDNPSTDPPTDSPSNDGPPSDDPPEDAGGLAPNPPQAGDFGIPSIDFSELTGYKTEELELTLNNPNLSEAQKEAVSKELERRKNSDKEKAQEAIQAIVEDIEESFKQEATKEGYLKEKNRIARDIRKLSTRPETKDQLYNQLEAAYQGAIRNIKKEPTPEEQAQAFVDSFSAPDGDIIDYGNALAITSFVNDAFSSGNLTTYDDAELEQVEATRLFYTNDPDVGIGMGHEFIVEFVEPKEEDTIYTVKTDDPFKRESVTWAQFKERFDNNGVYSFNIGGKTYNLNENDFHQVRLTSTKNRKVVTYLHIPSWYLTNNNLLYKARKEGDYTPVTRAIDKNIKIRRSLQELIQNNPNVAPKVAITSIFNGDIKRVQDQNVPLSSIASDYSLPLGMFTSDGDLMLNGFDRPLDDVRGYEAYNNKLYFAAEKNGKYYRVPIKAKELKDIPELYNHMVTLFTTIGDVFAKGRNSAHAEMWELLQNYYNTTVDTQANVNIFSSDLSIKEESYRLLMGLYVNSSKNGREGSGFRIKTDKKDPTQAYVYINQRAKGISLYNLEQRSGALSTLIKEIEALRIDGNIALMKKGGDIKVPLVTEEGLVTDLEYKKLLMDNHSFLIKTVKTHQYLDSNQEVRDNYSININPVMSVTPLGEIATPPVFSDTNTEAYEGGTDSELGSGQESTTTQVNAIKTDISIGKIPNTEYEVKPDGIYWKGKKLNNPENLSHKELIEADIRRRNQEELEKLPSYNWKEKILKAKNIQELAPIVLEVSGKDINSTSDFDGSLRGALLTPGVWDRAKELLVKDLESIERFFDKAEKNKINAKYNAELESLNNQSVEQQSDTEIEQTKPKPEEAAQLAQEEYSDEDIIRLAEKLTKAPRERYVDINRKELGNFVTGAKYTRARDYFLKEIRKTIPKEYLDEINNLSLLRDEEGYTIEIDSEYQIPGSDPEYTEFQLQQAMGFISERVIEAYINGEIQNNKDEEIVIQAIEDFRTVLEERAKELDTLFEETNDINALIRESKLLLDFIGGIDLNNWDLIKKNINLKVSALIQKDATELLERQEEELMDQFNDTKSFELVPKMKASKLVKYLVSSLKTTDGSYVNPDLVVSKLFETLGFKTGNYYNKNIENVLLKLEDINPETFPWRDSLIEKLKTLKNTTLPNQFLNIFHVPKGNYYNLVLYKNFVRILRTDYNNLSQHIRNLSMNRLLELFEVEEETGLLLGSSLQTLGIKNILESKYTNITQVREFLSLLGVDVSSLSENELEQVQVLRANKKPMLIVDYFKAVKNGRDKNFLIHQYFNSKGEFIATRENVYSDNLFSSVFGKLAEKSNLVESSTIRDGDKLISVFTSNSRFYTKFSERTTGEQNPIDVYEESSEFFDDIEHLDYFTLPLRPFYQKNSNVVKPKFNEMDKGDKTRVSVLHFFGEGRESGKGKNKYKANYLHSALADKTRTFGITWYRERFIGDLSDIESDDNTYLYNRVYRTLIEPDINRMIHQPSLDLDLQNYEPLFFYGIPELNTIPAIQQEFIKIKQGEGSAEALAEAIENSQDQIKEITFKFLEKKVNNAQRTFKKHKIAEPTLEGGATMSNPFSKGYYTYNLIHKNVIDSYSKSVEEGKAMQSQLAKDWALNSLLFQGNVKMFMDGDPAQYAKNRIPLAPKPENTYSQEAIAAHNKATKSNLVKRLAKLSSPSDNFSVLGKIRSLIVSDSTSRTTSIRYVIESQDSNFEEKWKKQVKDQQKRGYEGFEIPEEYSEDIVGDLIAIYDSLPSEYLSSFIDTFFPRSEEYFRIDHADALELVHWKHHLDILEADGVINNAKKQELINKIEKGIPLLKEDKDSYFNSFKPLYVGERVEGKTRIQDFVKSSHVPVLPNLTENLDELLQYMEKDNIQRIAFESAVKQGKPNNLPVLFDPLTQKFIGSKTLIENYGHAVVEYDGKFFGKQLETGFETKTEISDSIQHRKLSTAGIKNERVKYKGRDHTVRELEEKKKKLYEKKFKRELNKLRAKITVKTENGYAIDYAKLHEFLLEEMRSRGFTPNEQNYVKLIGRENTENLFSLNLYHTKNKGKYESFLLSVVSKKTVRGLKRYGLSSAQGSSLGIIKGNVKDKIVWVDENKDTLNMVDGVAEIVVPWYFKGKLADFTKDGLIDLDKLPPELLSSVSFRIPHQHHPSIVAARIVGFLPESMPNTVLVPSILTKKMGSDFDIDKLYSYIYETKAIPDKNLLYSHPELVEIQERINGLKRSKASFIRRLESHFDASSLSQAETYIEYLNELQENKSNILDPIENQITELYRLKAKIANRILNRPFKEDLDYVKILRYEKDEQSLDNQLLDIDLAIFAGENKVIQQSLLTVLDSAMDRLEDTILKYRVETDDPFESFADPLYQLDRYEAGASGKLGVSLMAQFLTFLGNAEGNNVSFITNESTPFFGLELDGVPMVNDISSLWLSEARQKLNDFHSENNLLGKVLVRNKETGKLELVKKNSVKYSDIAPEALQLELVSKYMSEKFSVPIQLVDSDTIRNLVGGDIYFSYLDELQLERENFYREVATIKRLEAKNRFSKGTVFNVKNAAKKLKKKYPFLEDFISVDTGWRIDHLVINEDKVEEYYDDEIFETEKINQDAIENRISGEDPFLYENYIFSRNKEGFPVGAYDAATNTVYVDKDNASVTTPIHEVLHPFIETLKDLNPELYQELLSEAEGIIPDADLQYYSSEKKDSERIIRALEQIIADRKNYPTGSGFIAAVKKFIEFVRQIADTALGGKLAKGELITAKDFDTIITLEQLSMIVVNSDSKIGILPAQINTSRLEDLDTSNIKEGVPELFESDKELANEVYEALGFKLDFEINTKDGIIIKAFHEGESVGIIDIQKSNNEYFVRGVESNFENQGIGTKIYKKAIEYVTQQGGVLKPDILSAPQSYSIYKKLEKEGLFKITNISEQHEDGRYEIEGQSTGKLPTSQITPEQKQKALEAYSQYLDTIFPDSKVKDIVYHGSYSKNIDKFSKDVLSRTSLTGFLPKAFYFTNQQYVAATYTAPKDVYNRAVWSSLVDFIEGVKDEYGNYVQEPGSFEKLLSYIGKSDNQKEFIIDYRDGKLEDSFGGAAEAGLFLPSKKDTELYLKFIKNKDLEGIKKKRDEYSSEEGKIYSSILNIKTPLYKKTATGSITTINLEGRTTGEKKITLEKELKNSDGLIISDIRDSSDYRSNKNIKYDENIDEQTYVVFESEQIHILGSKQDIEGFKGFVEESTHQFIKPKVDTTVSWGTLKNQPVYTEQESVNTKEYNQKIADLNKGKKVKIKYDSYKNSFEAEFTGKVEEVSSPTEIRWDDGRVEIKDDGIYRLQFKTNTGKIVTASTSEIEGNYIKPEPKSLLVNTMRTLNLAPIKQNLFTVQPTATPDMKKAPAKASIATKYIGFGDRSTGMYAEQIGPEYANTGQYVADDVVFVSINGNITKEKLDKTITEVKKALAAGATILTDNESDTKKSSYNRGEKALQEWLNDNGYSSVDIEVDGATIGVWNHSHKHFGNLFSASGYSGTIKMSSIEAAIQAYKDWLLGKDNQSKLDLGKLSKTGKKTEWEGFEGYNIEASSSPNFQGFLTKTADGNYNVIEKTTKKRLPLSGFIENTQKAVLEALTDYIDNIKLDVDGIKLAKSLNITVKETINPQQRQWILEQINSGKLDNATLLYDSKLPTRPEAQRAKENIGYSSHAEALADIVAELRSKQESPQPSEQLDKPSVHRTLDPEQEANPFAVFVVATLPDGSVASTTRAADTGEAGRIGLPGGKVDPGENPTDALMREAAEEGWQLDSVGEIIASKMVDGQPVVWYRGVNPQALTEYKEKERGIEPISATVEEISNSGFGNEFISEYLSSSQTDPSSENLEEQLQRLENSKSEYLQKVEAFLERKAAMREKYEVLEDWSTPENFQENMSKTHLKEFIEQNNLKSDILDGLDTKLTEAVAYETAAVDNANKSMLHAGNINKHTFDFIRPAIAYGWSMEQIQKVISKPIIKEYYELIDSKKGISEYSEDPIGEALDEIAEAYGHKDYFNNPERNIFRKIDLDAFDRADTQGQNLASLRLLDSYLRFVNQNVEFSRALSLMNVDSTGIGGDFAEFKLKVEQLQEAKEAASGSYYLADMIANSVSAAPLRNMESLYELLNDPAINPLHESNKYIGNIYDEIAYIMGDEFMDTYYKQAEILNKISKAGIRIQKANALAAHFNTTVISLRESLLFESHELKETTKPSLGNILYSIQNSSLYELDRNHPRYVTDPAFRSLVDSIKADRIDISQDPFIQGLTKRPIQVGDRVLDLISSVIQNTENNFNRAANENSILSIYNQDAPLFVYFDEVGKPAVYSTADFITDLFSYTVLTGSQDIIGNIDGLPSELEHMIFGTDPVTGQSPLSVYDQARPDFDNPSYEVSNWTKTFLFMFDEYIPTVYSKVKDNISIDRDAPFVKIQDGDVNIIYQRTDGDGDSSTYKKLGVFKYKNLFKTIGGEGQLISPFMGVADNIKVREIKGRAGKHYRGLAVPKTVSDFFESHRNHSNADIRLAVKYLSLNPVAGFSFVPKEVGSYKHKGEYNIKTNPEEIAIREDQFEDPRTLLHEIVHGALDIKTHQYLNLKKGENFHVPKGALNLTKREIEVFDQLYASFETYKEYYSSERTDDNFSIAALSFKEFLSEIVSNPITRQELDEISKKDASLVDYAKNIFRNIIEIVKKILYVGNKPTEGRVSDAFLNSVLWLTIPSIQELNHTGDPVRLWIDTNNKIFYAENAEGKALPNLIGKESTDVAKKPETSLYEKFMAEQAKKETKRNNDLSVEVETDLAQGISGIGEDFDPLEGYESFYPENFDGIPSDDDIVNIFTNTPPFSEEEGNEESNEEDGEDSDASYLIDMDIPSRIITDKVERRYVESLRQSVMYRTINRYNNYLGELEARERKAIFTINNPHALIDEKSKAKKELERVEIDRDRTINTLQNIIDQKELEDVKNHIGAEISYLKSKLDDSTYIPSSHELELTAEILENLSILTGKNTEYASESMFSYLGLNPNAFPEEEAGDLKRFMTSMNTQLIDLFGKHNQASHRWLVKTSSEEAHIHNIDVTSIHKDWNQLGTLFLSVDRTDEEMLSLYGLLDQKTEIEKNYYLRDKALNLQTLYEKAAPWLEKNKGNKYKQWEGFIEDGKIVSKYSERFYETQRSHINRLNKVKKKLNAASDKEHIKKLNKELNEAYKQLNQFYENNKLVINPLKLSDPDYVLQLENTLGAGEAAKKIKEAEEAYINFQKNYEAYKNNLEDTLSLSEKAIAARLKEYQIANDPAYYFIWAEYNKNRDVYTKENFLLGYTDIDPSIFEVEEEDGTITTHEAKWPNENTNLVEVINQHDAITGEANYSDKYKHIASNQDALNLYEAIKDTIAEARSKLPEHTARTLRGNELPWVEKLMFEGLWSDLLKVRSLSGISKIAKRLIYNIMGKLASRLPDIVNSKDPTEVSVNLSRGSKINNYKIAAKRYEKTMLAQGIPLEDIWSTDFTKAHVADRNDILNRMKEEVAAETHDFRSYDLLRISFMYLYAGVDYEFKSKNISKKAALKRIAEKKLKSEKAATKNVGGHYISNETDTAPNKLKLLRHQHSQATNTTVQGKYVPIHPTFKAVDNIEKFQKDQLLELIGAYEQRLLDPNLTPEQKFALEEKLDEYQEELNSLGGRIFLSSIFTSLARLHTMRALGFSLNSFIPNMLYGLIQNEIASNDERIYSKETYKKIRNNIYSGSTFTKFAIPTLTVLFSQIAFPGIWAGIAAYSIGNILASRIKIAPNSNKIVNFLLNNNQLQKVQHELRRSTPPPSLYTTKLGRSLKKAGLDKNNLLYMFTEESEIPHQATIVGSVLDSVVLEDGQTLLDYINEDGSIKEPTQVVNHPKTTDALGNPVRIKIEDLVKENMSSASSYISKTHGNYRDNMRQMAKYDDLGTLALTMRSWMPEAYYSRYEGEKRDFLIQGHDTVGITQKGYYRTAHEQLGTVPLAAAYLTKSASTGIFSMLLGATPILSLIPVAIQVGALYYASKNIKRHGKHINKDEISRLYMKDLTYSAMKAFTLGRHVNPKHAAIKQELGKNLSEIDRINLNKLTTEVIFTLMFTLVNIITLAMAKALASMRDDDDEKDSIERLNMYVNNFSGRMAKDLEAYYSPSDFYDKNNSVSQIFPVLQTVDLLRKGFNNLDMETYQRKTGKYEAGDLKLLKQLEEFFPGITQADKINNYSEKQFELFKQ